jgi:hypothetical protein
MSTSWPKTHKTSAGLIGSRPTGIATERLHGGTHIIEG